jgi:hypothetical protein
MQKTKIKAFLSDADERCQEFESLQNQYNKDFDTLTEMDRREILGGNLLHKGRLQPYF